MNFLGISGGFHDAAAAVVSRHGDIIFAGHSERYSKQKNDANVCTQLLNDIDMDSIGTIAYYERPLVKQLRQWYAGQGVEWNRLTTRQVLTQQLGANVLSGKRLESYNHHQCHAAGGFQTSTFDRATVVVIDAVGEFETVTIWAAEYDSKGRAKYKRLWGQRYPHSIGMFYSAVTARVGLRPLDEEYILMGMAAYGKPVYKDVMKHDFVHDLKQLKFKQNLHAGLASDYLAAADPMDIAASAQQLTTDLVLEVMLRAAQFQHSKNLVYSGGVSLNCSINQYLGRYFDRIWIMPSPGDAGSSIGAAALVYGKQVEWTTAFLGHAIPGAYPVNAIIDQLLTTKIVGVASGPAEFGPRALGNRSLLADPRGNDIKNQVNAIKRRQQFRPFAPAILEECTSTYFDMPKGFTNSRYMQSVANCRSPDLFPAIVHHDGTSRVQTVPADGSGLRLLLEKWYATTGCPMLLNTSLNIRGEPMVNDRVDADRFELLYGVKVCS